MNIYNKIILNSKVILNFKDINSNLESVFEKKIRNEIEGKCINEGYIKKNSIKIISYSSGELHSFHSIFEVVYECLVANPVESMQINCKVLSITKVGIRAGLLNNDIDNPFIIFIARDHHYNNELFNKIKLNDILNIKVLGKRFELYDPFISIIAELLEIKSSSNDENQEESEIIKKTEKTENIENQENSENKEDVYTPFNISLPLSKVNKIKSLKSKNK